MQKNRAFSFFPLNKRTKSAYPFCIGNEQLREESTTTYLGTLQDVSLKSVKRTRASIQKGRNAFHAMIGYGVKPNGVNPLTAISLYRKNYYTVCALRVRNLEQSFDVRNK